MKIYHGGEKIKNEVKIPFFCYDTLSNGVYFATGYSGVNDGDEHVSEFELSSKAKVLDLTKGNVEKKQKIVDEIMKKCDMTFETEYLELKGSFDSVGREVFGYDINLALYPKFREEMLKLGYNVLKTDTTFESSLPVGYAVLDNKAVIFKKEYRIEKDDFEVKITVTKCSSLESSTVGQSFVGDVGMGDIQFKKVEKSKKTKKI